MNPISREIKNLYNLVYQFGPEYYEHFRGFNELIELDFVEF